MQSEKMNKSPAWNISAATKEEAEFVDKKLSESIRNQIHLTQETIFKNYIIKDEGKIIAGINALIYPWGILYIDVLFVEESHRYQGFGSALLKRLEDEAKVMGAALSNLTSFDFQARDFYIKQGYEIFGVLEDSPKGHTLYFLKKVL
jgi:GNAT superfamily N-acetyltransferase